MGGRGRGREGRGGGCGVVVNGVVYIAGCVGENTFQSVGARLKMLMPKKINNKIKKSVSTSAVKAFGWQTDEIGLQSASPTLALWC